MKLYHGSTTRIQKPSLNKGRSKTDFGKGFYTTTSVEQARKWAIIKKNREETDKTFVSVFEIDDNIFEKNYSVLFFEGATTEWLDFVVKNRRGEPTSIYDLVKGPVANDKLYATINLFEQGILSAEATIEQLNTHTLFDQLSFHSDRAMQELRFVESFEASDKE
ncbi:MAG: DUF3990 domain-containing protein [Prevotellaceae bacterium]|jgi:hypothetical protein|nr:DUF3990 domain-containing protein [Prevotellaceae bacterium]